MVYTQIQNLADAPPPHPTFLTVGSFDGVHMGHQTIFKQMVEAAQKVGARTAVLTFFPHPRRIINNQQGRYYLTSLQDRVALIAQQGIDLIITHPFNEEVRHTSAESFVTQLHQALHLTQFWGSQISLGYQREGDSNYLQTLGSQMGFTVQTLNAMTHWNGAVVSSSRIREGLKTGNVEDVAGCLGRPFHLTGTVVQGAQRGRTIGFPTANINAWDELLLPANGVYATYLWVNGVRHQAATNIGVRPTVDGTQQTIESHLLDFTGDLYGQTVKLEFQHQIRAEKKFSGLDELKAQIALDVTQIRQLL